MRGMDPKIRVRFGNLETEELCAQRVFVFRLCSLRARRLDAERR
jgi:hypothetical protein